MRTLGAGVAEFFAANLRHTKGALIGQPFILEPWQSKIIDLIYEIDEEGRRKWRTVLLGIPRGNGKSPLAAGIGLLELVDRDDAPDIYVAAAARDQAAIIHDFAHGMPKGGPLEDFIHFPKSKKSVLTTAHNNGSMKVLSADGDLQHGLSSSVVLIDELHCFKSNKQEELYFALVTSTQKRKESITLIITTAGANKASLLGEKHEAMLKTHKLEYSEDKCMVIGRDESVGSLLIWIGAPENADVNDRKIWRACNPASWIPLFELERLASEVPESVFRRLVLNQWVLGNDAAIQPGSWDACENQEEADIEEGADAWAAVDVGERRDTSSITIVSPNKDGKLRTKTTVFNPAKEHVKTLLPMIEAEVRRIAGTYNLRGVGFDPWQFRRSAELLSSDGIRMIEVPQNETHMVPASALLYDFIEQQKIIHDGDPILRQHVLAAEAKQTSRGAWRLVKPLQSHGRRTDESQKVDAAIALAMACAAWSYDNTKSGGLWAETW
jgi:phage terminase large subunit-like protein